MWIYSNFLKFLKSDDLLKVLQMHAKVFAYIYICMHTHTQVSIKNHCSAVYYVMVSKATLVEKPERVLDHFYFHLCLSELQGGNLQLVHMYSFQIAV